MPKCLRRLFLSLTISFSLSLSLASFLFSFGLLFAFRHAKYGGECLPGACPAGQTKGRVRVFAFKGIVCRSQYDTMPNICLLLPAQLGCLLGRLYRHCDQRSNRCSGSDWPKHQSSIRYVWRERRVQFAPKLIGQHLLFGQH